MACPLPARYEHVVLGHGSGGRLSSELLERVFLPAFDDAILARREDAAVLPGRMAFTTDSFVVRPLFFPGGDIGRLAVCGTINDLAMSGARPQWLSAAFILEEGLPFADLRRIVASMRDACREAGVRLVAGDTKVVDRGKGDGVFIATAGIGTIPAGRDLLLAAARPGDRIIVSGTIGDHGVAVMSVREGLSFATRLESDVAPLAALAEAMLSASPLVRCMRDPTRGGLAGALNEIASAARVGMRIDETAIPLRPEVAAACELLGLDPLHVANEGKVVAVVAAEAADAVIAAMRRHAQGHAAAVIGDVVAEDPGVVVLRGRAGGERVVDQLDGEQLPRIC